MASYTLLIASTPIEGGDPLGLASRTNDDLSESYFRATDLFPALIVSGRGDRKNRRGEIIEVSLHFMVEGEIDAAVNRLKAAFESFSFPKGTSVIKMWRGEDLVARNAFVFEHA